MMQYSEYESARLADRLIIQDLLYLMCRSVDRRDWDTWRTLYHPDCVFDNGVNKGDLETTLKFQVRRHATVSHSYHQIPNIFIEFTGRDTALVEAYTSVWQRHTADAFTGDLLPPGEPAFDRWSMARFINRFERRDSKWRILHHSTITEFSRMSPVPPDQPHDPRAISQRDRSDPLWAARAQLSL
jgi:SnoaL-like domain